MVDFLKEESTTQILPFDLDTDSSLLYIPPHLATWLKYTQPGTFRKAIQIVPFGMNTKTIVK